MKEIFKDIEGYDGTYQVSNLGKVKSNQRAVNCKDRYFKTLPAINFKPTMRGQYLKVTLRFAGRYKNENIHRLVAGAFIDNPENKPFVNHKDGNKFNNCSDNLEWLTPSENTRHALRHSLMNTARGEAKIRTAKLTTVQILSIRQEVKSAPQTEVAKKYGVCQQAISRIVTHRNWAHIK